MRVMKRHAAIALLFSAAVQLTFTAAVAYLKTAEFDVPGLGRVVSDYAFASGLNRQAPCIMIGERDHNALGRLPVTIYLRLTRPTTEYAVAHLEVRDVAPNGAVEIHAKQTIIFNDGDGQHCFQQQFLRFPQRGTYTITAYLNGSQVATWFHTSR